MMSVSHTFLNTLSSFFEKHAVLKNSQKLSVAVSGGSDSMALAHALINSPECKNKEIHILSVDHGLREEAAQELQMVSKWVRDIGAGHVQHHILKWEGEKPESGVLERAREARYDLMASYCETQNTNSIFLGHHQDDQAETFLIRLCKGSGLDGLAAMAPVVAYREGRDISLCRPFLDVPKEDLVEYCKAHDIPFAHDPSNGDSSYLRPRLREVRNILEKEGLSTKRLAVTAGRMARARQALEEIAVRVYENCVMECGERIITFDWEQLRHQPAEMGLRVVQMALFQFGREKPYPVRLERLEDLFDSLWYNAAHFKPRTLGGVKISLKKKRTILCIEAEQAKD
ncbi:MAG: tRNA lysidine(34) synthetase TilS [Alphaproteobacteria bacterium]|nr:tRNA lysidine(34) synthetase TilS [Alphaproteobacteria bacterium]